MRPAKETIIINADNFSTLEEFYDEIDNVLTKDLEWQTGHNYDAFDDLLRGGFGVHEEGEHITLVWKNAKKSKSDLRKFRKGKRIYQTLVEIIRDHPHIEFIED